MFKRLNQKIIYQDAWLTLYQDEIEFPDGSQGTYAWVDRKNGVGVVVVTPDNRLLLHREYRHVIGGYSWEVPGGGIDEGETPEQAAIRELKEEAGIEVSERELTKLGEFYPLNSFNTERVTIFMTTVKDVHVHTEGTEGSEAITAQRFVSFNEALRMIDQGEINDALTANVVQMAIRRRI